MLINVGTSAPDGLDEADFKVSYRRIEMDRIEMIEM